MILVFFLLLLVLWAGAWQLESVRGRQFLLLLISYAFYWWFAGPLIAILVVTSLANFGLGRLVRTLRLEYLWLAVGVNVGLLAVFKYLPEVLATLAPTQANVVRLVMPVGMSFWTFQALSYHIDTYLEEDIDPTVLEFCLYMAFWPTVIAGPVCRLPEMLPQFRRIPRVVPEEVAQGALQIVQGTLMKFYLAQLLASGWSPGSGVTAGFDAATAWGGIDVWMLALGYGFQLFFDFAGYSLIVIGVARMFGILLPQNFNRPYLSLTPAMFWTRWHMSLSSWIRDYVFRPLCATRREKWWLYVSLVFSMMLFGLWHGAKLTFVLWGVYHGLLLVAHRIGQQLKKRLPFRVPRLLGTCSAWAATFALVSVGYVLFRANNLAQLGAMLTALVTPSAYRKLALPGTFYTLTSAMVLGYFAVAGAGLLLHSLRSTHQQASASSAAPADVRQLSWSNTLSALGGVVDFLAARMWWWLAPAIVSLAALVALAISVQHAKIATTPFIYTLF
jgi:alginate O-acetyltransferase complex protein AlgI